MTSSIAGSDSLGGRLLLLSPDDLDEQQKPIYEGLRASVVPESAASGFVARLADGRFIGPFNAMLRAPHITAGFGQWATAIARSGMADDVRQVVILTIGAAWHADFEISAHTAAARAVGVADSAIGAILDGTTPQGLTREAELGHRLARSLVVDHLVPDELYRDAIEVFGEPGTMAVLNLIGQYQTISSILVTFEVPVPGPDAAETGSATHDH